MSTLDDAILAHMTHGAGAGADPLTDSLVDQAQLQQPRPVRANWERETIAPPIPWAFYGLVVACTVAVSALLSGCGGDSGPDEDTTSTTQPVNCVATPEKCK
jgi:hypothetical protein